MFDLMRKYLRLEAEMRERKRRELLARTISALNKLSSRVKFRGAYIFGSITKPYMFFDSSDVDIAFLGLEEDKLFFTVAFLSEEIGRDVDVIELEKAPFKDKILREGIRWRLS